MPCRASFAAVICAAIFAQPTAGQDRAGALPVAAMPSAGARAFFLYTLQPAGVRCATGSPTPVHIEPPFVELRPQLPERALAPITYSFAIDPTGRPITIAPADGGTADTPFGHAVNADASPSLAAWRFVEGERHEGCSVTFTSVAVPLEQAPASLAAHFYMQPGGRFGSEHRRILFDRIQPEQSDCADPPPVPRRRAFPAFDELETPLGGWSYVMTSFDIDASGRPTHVATLSSNSSSSKTAAALDAVRASRFAPGGRRGCTYPYWFRSAAAMPAPQRPDKAAFVRRGDACEGETQWAHTGALIFPPAYQRRGIEGWALVRFDAAADGSTSNVDVVAAEPTADFGAMALRVIADSQLEAHAMPRTGCLDFVVYRLPARGWNGGG